MVARDQGTGPSSWVRRSLRSICQLCLMTRSLAKRFLFAQSTKLFPPWLTIFLSSPNLPNFSLGSILKNPTALLVSQSCTNDPSLLLLAGLPSKHCLQRNLSSDLQGHLLSRMDSSIDWSPPWPSAHLHPFTCELSPTLCDPFSHPEDEKKPSLRIHQQSWLLHAQLTSAAAQHPSWG